MGSQWGEAPKRVQQNAEGCQRMAEGRVPITRGGNQHEK
jgi:hypothetical protein